MVYYAAEKINLEIDGIVNEIKVVRSPFFNDEKECIEYMRSHSECKDTELECVNLV